ncbi:MAG: efflux RND transporter periplasmic adaptor subunit [Cytophagales bacterium]|nr:efflux RND transporter periplasmic adaptor subunit [Bernardetiaceae bacterium]MDW8204704.1 efflux RND transporter periplasmic adaptor subunit [Cytophagales bacterium]
MTKYYAFVFIALFAVSACNKSVDNSVEGKRKRLSELKKQAAQIKAEIAALEAEIAQISPTAAAKKLVEAEPLSVQDFAHYVEVQGNVASEQNVMIAPEIAGVIIKRYVQVGDMVRKGQPIAEIDAESIRKNIAEIETRLELARTVYERQANLWNQKIGSEVQYLQAKNNMEALEKTLATAKTQLNKAIVKAPIDGMVEDLTQNVGEMANPAVPMGRIVNIAQVEINADVSEVYATAVKRGDEVLVSFPALGKEMSLKIHMVGQYINPTNRTFKIQMRTSNPDGILKPNSLAVVKIRDFFRKDALVLPSHLIQQSANGEQFVYVLRNKDGKQIVERVVITTGKSYAGKTLVEAGIQAGDLIITKGYNEVVNGDEVEVSNNKVAQQVR